MKTLYFAYGSNMSIEQMMERCPRADNLGPAVLNGWQLVERTHADIEPCKGEQVHGVVWGVSPMCVGALDRYEGFPNYYTKKKVWVKMYDCVAKIQVVVYVMTKRAASKKEQYHFSEYYGKACAKGARDNGVEVHALYGRTEKEWEEIYIENFSIATNQIFP